MEIFIIGRGNIGLKSVFVVQASQILANFFSHEKFIECFFFFVGKFVHFIGLFLK